MGSVEIDEELEDDAVGENAELGGGDRVVMGAQFIAGVGQIGTDLLAFDGDHRLAVTQNREIDLVGLVGVGGVLRVDLVGVGVVVAEQPKDRQHEIELGAFLVAARAHEANRSLGNRAKASAQFILGVHRCIPPRWRQTAPNRIFFAANLEHGPSHIRSAGR